MSRLTLNAIGKRLVDAALAHALAWERLKGADDDGDKTRWGQELHAHAEDMEHAMQALREFAQSEARRIVGRDA